MARYMKNNKLNMAGLFNKLDENKDGLLSRDEMRNLFFQEFKMDIEEDEFNNFFDNFDMNKTDTVNIQEFVNVIQPELAKVANEIKMRSSSTMPGHQLD